MSAERRRWTDEELAAHNAYLDRLAAWREENRDELKRMERRRKLPERIGAAWWYVLLALGTIIYGWWFLLAITEGQP